MLFVKLSFAMYIYRMGQAEIDSVDVAKALMAEAGSQGLRLNMTQLQKLLYIVYGTCLVMLGRPPFSTEQPQAWPFGPVFPTTRRKLSDEVKNGSVKACPETVPAELRRIVDKVVESFGTWKCADAGGHDVLVNSVSFEIRGK